MLGIVDGGKLHRIWQKAPAAVLQPLDLGLFLPSIGEESLLLGPRCVRFPVIGGQIIFQLRDPVVVRVVHHLMEKLLGFHIRLPVLLLHGSVIGLLVGCKGIVSGDPQRSRWAIVRNLLGKGGLLLLQLLVQGLPFLRLHGGAV